MDPKLRTYSLQSTTVAFPEDETTHVYGYLTAQWIKKLPKWFVGVALRSYFWRRESRMFKAVVCSLKKVKSTSFPLVSIRRLSNEKFVNALWECSSHFIGTYLGLSMTCSWSDCGACVVGKVPFWSTSISVRTWCHINKHKNVPIHTPRIVTIIIPRVKNKYVGFVVDEWVVIGQGGDPIRFQCCNEGKPLGVSSSPRDCLFAAISME